MEEIQHDLILRTNLKDPGSFTHACSHPPLLTLHSSISRNKQDVFKLRPIYVSNDTKTILQILQSQSKHRPDWTSWHLLTRSQVCMKEECGVQECIGLKLCALHINFPCCLVYSAFAIDLYVNDYCKEHERTAPLQMEHLYRQRYLHTCSYCCPICTQVGMSKNSCQVCWCRFGYSMKNYPCIH